MMTELYRRAGVLGARRALWLAMAWLACLTLEASEGPGTNASPASMPVAERVGPLELRGVRLGDPDAPEVAVSNVSAFRSQLEQAQSLRKDREYERAEQHLKALLGQTMPEEIHREALMELAEIAEERGNLTRAQQVLSQFVSRFHRHPGVVEAYLRLGRVYRRMGATGLATSKFYAVMTSALSLRLDQLEHYQKLVLQAQLEIAETHYQDGRWEQAREFFGRLLKLDHPGLDRAEVEFKMIRSIAMQEKHDETVLHAERFLAAHGDSPDAPEARFLLATALRHLGRTQEALNQVLILLESQRAKAEANPESWAYWQKRAGNEIANQLYREGDFVATLAVYERLAQLDASAAWQIPVWYQIGLVYERLRQPARAVEKYSEIVRRGEGLVSEETPALAAVIRMARWRRDHLGWLQSASASVAALSQKPVSESSQDGPPAQLTSTSTSSSAP
jgi:tetratricopeptide (TPR) repeat protein